MTYNDLFSHINKYYFHDINNHEWQNISEEERHKRFLKIEKTTIRNLNTSSFKEDLFNDKFGVVKKWEDREHDEWERNFKKEYFKWMLFQKTNFAACSFSSGVFECQFIECKFENVNFQKGIFKCNFLKCEFINCQFGLIKECVLEKCQYSNCNFEGCEIENSSLYINSKFNNSYLGCKIKKSKLYGFYENNRGLQFNSIDFDNCEFCIKSDGEINLCSIVEKINNCTFNNCNLAFRELSMISNSTFSACHIKGIKGKYDNYINLIDSIFTSSILENIEYANIFRCQFESTTVNQLSKSNLNESHLNSSEIKSTISDCKFRDCTLISSTLYDIKKTNFTGMTDFSNLKLKGDFYPNCSFEKLNLSNLNAIRPGIPRIDQIDNCGLNMLKLNSTVVGLPQIVYCLDNGLYYSQIVEIRDKDESGYELKGFSPGISTSLLLNEKFEFTSLELINELNKVILGVNNYFKGHNYIFKDEPKNRNYKFELIKDNIISKIKFLIDFVKFIEENKEQLKLSTELKELPFDPLK